MQFDDSRPIWSQLTEEFQRRIVSGEWPPGERVPSVRELATELRVNPNTVQKALVELDRSGLTMPERTAGRYVTDLEVAISEARTQLAKDLSAAFVRAAVGMRLREEEAFELIKKSWEESVLSGDNRAGTVADQQGIKKRKEI